MPKKKRVNETKKQRAKHDWLKYRQDFLGSKHVTVASWAKEYFGLPKGSKTPGWIGAQTRGRSKEKEELRQQGVDDAQEVVAETMRGLWVGVIKDAAKSEMEVVKHLVDMVKHEITDKKYIERNIGIERLDFLLKSLRTVQGKASEYGGDEGADGTLSPMDEMLQKLGYKVK